MGKAMRILITGATGFVGGYLVEQCRERYPQAEIFGLYNRNMLQHVSAAMEHVISLKADIMQAEDVRSALAQSRPDIIFHLAAQSSVAASWSDPAYTLQVNALGTLCLLEVARLEHSTARIVLVGSGEQYGAVPPHQNPISEECALKPINPYAVSKATQDLYGHQYFVAYGLPVVRVRSFNHFGPRQSAAFVLPGFARQIALIEAGKAEPVVLVGNLEAKRDFLPVEDVVAAYLAVAVYGQSGEVYNVGSGKALSIGEMLDLLLSFAKVPIRIHKDAARMRPVDTPILEADISRIQAQTGWKPTVPLESALKEMLDYWRTVVATAPERSVDSV
ncbi:MAG: GDP-mannose 4,6-dehydratase [Ktedonobacteraceae bacterium]